MDASEEGRQAAGLPEVQEPQLGHSEAAAEVTALRPNALAGVAGHLGQPSRSSDRRPAPKSHIRPGTDIRSEDHEREVTLARLPSRRSHRNLLNLANPVRVFDFFCGCGGASSGFRTAGMEIALGLDNDADAQRTFEANFPEAGFIGDDIATVSASAIDPVVDACADHPLLFNACAPCQPFSQQRRGVTSPDDERLGLLDHVLRFVRRHRPELIFAENVPGLREGGATRGVFQRLLCTLETLGYSTDYRVIKSQDYGVPQRRARLVVLASRLGPIRLPGPTHGFGTSSTTHATVRDWIGTLPAISAGEAHPSVPNHRAARLSPLNLQRIRATPPGGGWRDLPSDLMPASRRSGFTGFTDVYGRLKWDAPAPALTTRCISYSNGRFGHPEQDRAISVREAACLQTLPADFVLTGNLNSQARQVGNAVPALLAQRFGECITEHLAGIVRSAGTALQECPRRVCDARRGGLLSP